jgi:hypothetical protein
MIVDINAECHPAQMEVKNSSARFRVLSAGRRFGKSRLAIWECIHEATRTAGRRVWYVAPSYKLGATAFRELSRIGGLIPGVEIKHAERTIVFPDTSTIVVRSADDYNSLRGEGLDFCVIDEASYTDYRAWEQAIRPSLSDRLGRCLMISTPAGKNNFYRLYQKGRTDPDWESWTFPTAANPHILKSEIDAAKSDLPEIVFRQEYLAEFVDDNTSVFRRVLDAVNGDTAPPITEHSRYVVGCDYGRTNDATAFAVLDLDSGHIVELDRMTQTDYQTQINRLVALVEKYNNASVVSEYNSMGGPLTEALIGQGLDVEAFHTNPVSKARVIDGLSLAFERGEIHIPNDPILINELQSYESKRLPSGRMQYSAPSGQHDDTVIATALAWSARESAAPIILMHV